MSVRGALLAATLGLAAMVPGRVSAMGSPEALPMADRVVVVKSERRLYLMRGGVPYRSFKVWLGLAPKGHKEQEGDFRTPEGLYRLGGLNRFWLRLGARWSLATPPTLRMYPKS